MENSVEASLHVERALDSANFSWDSKNAIVHRTSMTSITVHEHKICTRSKNRR